MIAALQKKKKEIRKDLISFLTPCRVLLRARNGSSGDQLMADLLQGISKMHLTLNNCVKSLLKMLTYSNVCCAFASAFALFLSVSYYF